jgi:hypothetical protein
MTRSHLPRHLPRSIGAILAGLLVIVILSIATDAAMYATRVFPHTGQPMSDALWLIPTGYRFAFSVLGSWLTAWLAPKQPMRHALSLGVIGFLLGMVGVIVALNANPPLGPTWYAIAVMALPFPAALVGGSLGGHASFKTEVHDG